METHKSIEVFPEEEIQGTNEIKIPEIVVWVQELNSVLEEVDYSDRNKERQQAVIDNLPPDFITELKAQIHTAYLEEESFGGTYKGKSFTELDESEKREFELQSLRGALFEMLIQNDKELVPKHSQAANELLTLMQNPERYNLLEEVGRIRNPDLAYIDINSEGRVIIKGVGEAKLGLLDSRALHQLKVFDESVNTLKLVVNNLRHSKKMGRLGLTGLAERKNQMEEMGEKGTFVDMAEDFSKVLIVPADREIEGDHVFENLFKMKLQNERNRSKFAEIKEQIQIKKSAFCVEEIAKMSEYVYKHMEKE